MMIRKLVAAAAFSLLGAAAQAGEIEAVNKSSVTIQHLFIAESASNRWSEDQLGDGPDDTIAPGDSYTLEGIEPGHYDLRLAGSDGTSCIVRDQRIGEDKMWTLTDAMLAACR
jgi:hypothetical protein